MHAHVLKRQQRLPGVHQELDADPCAKDVLLGRHRPSANISPKDLSKSSQVYAFRTTCLALRFRASKEAGA